MAISKEDILKTISEMSVMDVVELTKMMEEKFGVSAAVAIAAPAGGTGPAAPAQAEKTEFDVVITETGANKINVIKVLREVISGLGLIEAKNIVEKLPAVVKEKTDKKTADEMKQKLEAAGAKVEVK